MSGREKPHAAEHYEENGEDRFLVRDFQTEDCSRPELRMLIRNDPPGFLPMKLRPEGENLSVRFKISGLSPLSDKVTPENGVAFLHDTVFSLAELGPVLSDYFLSMEKVALQPEEIYCGEGRVLFLYLPVKKESFQQSLQLLMEWFLKKLNPKKEEEVLLLYSLYQKSRDRQVSTDTLKQCWLSAGIAGPVSAEEEKAPARPPSAEEPTRFLAAGPLPPEDFPFPEPRHPKNHDPGPLFPEDPAAESFPQEDLPGPSAEDFGPAAGEYGTDLFPGLSSENNSGRLKELLKKYRFELLIAGIIIAGIILFILI